MRSIRIASCSILGCLWFCCVAAAAPPVLSSDGPVNAASLAPGSLAPGSEAVVYGQNLAGEIRIATQAPLPLFLGGTSLYLNGMAVPLLFVSPTQINFQIPWELAGLSSATIVVIVDDVVSNVREMRLAPVAPGVFAIGRMQAAAVISATGEMAAPSGSIVGRAVRPSRRGEFLTIYATGLGPVTNQPRTGEAAPADRFSPVTTLPAVMIGGAPAIVTFAGLVPPGLVGPYAGLYQINVQVPPNALLGDAVPLAVSSGGSPANGVTIAVDAESTAPLYQWVQLGADNTVIARAITSNSGCPSMTLDGRVQPMQVRAAPSLPLYPVLSCELAIPAGTASANLEGQALRLPKSEPQRLLVLGDTGCRMDANAIQACNDPAAWPVAQVAASAAATRPDLVIHMGDYHYREVPCPAGNASCAGSPWGYNWDVWKADVFAPMQPLLEAAPWVPVRGNHEDCNRAWEGWFRFLDPRPFQTACQHYTDPYSVAVGALQLLVFDSAETNDTAVTPELAQTYTAKFDIVRQLAGPNAWLLHHHPLWGVNATTEVNVTMQAATNNTLPEGVKLDLAGHVHSFQALSFSPARSPQMVVGNGGDNLVQFGSRPIVGVTIAGASVSNATVFSRFGFTTFEPSATGWTAMPRDVSGQPEMVCSVERTAINCR